MEENDNELKQVETRTEPVKKRIRPVITYFRELSIVIAGIAITFMVSGWISDRREARELDNYIDAVKAELRDNLDILVGDSLFYSQTALLAHYLRSDRPENLDPDSVDVLNTFDYGKIINYGAVFDIKRSAFDMLQSTGMMRLIKDKKVSTSIIDSYTELTRTRNFCAGYMDRKTDMIYKAYMDNPNTEMNILSPSFRELYLFMAVHVNNDMVIRDCIGQLKHTLSLLQ